MKKRLAQPTTAVESANVGAIQGEILAPLPAADLEDAIVGASISFVVHSSCIEATCVVSKADPYRRADTGFEVGWLDHHGPKCSQINFLETGSLYPKETTSIFPSNFADGSI